MSVIHGSGAVTEQLTHFIQLIESLEGEKCALIANINDLYAKMRASGFEPRMIWQVVGLRAMDHNLLSGQDVLLDTYRDALDLR